jgi:hypothetical protein
MFSRPTRNLLLYGVLILLNGCVPIVGTYYVPHGPGQTVLASGPCSMVLSKAQQIQLDGEASLQVEVWRPDSTAKEYWISVSLLLRPRQQARFESSSLSVSFPPVGQPQSISLGETHGLSIETVPSSRVAQNATDTLDGGIGRDGQGEQKTIFTFKAALPFDSPRDFDLELPAIILGNRRIQIDPIHFVIEHGGRLFGVFCA